MVKDYKLSILVRTQNPRVLMEIQQAVSRAAVDPEDATMGVLSIHFEEVLGRAAERAECDICGGLCIGADA